MKKKKLERKLIKEPVSFYIDTYFFEGSVKTVAEKIKTIPEDLLRQAMQAELANNNLTGHKDGPVAYIKRYHDFEIRLTQDYDGTDVHIDGVRWETDEEFGKRVEKARKQALTAKKTALTKAAQKEIKDKALYEVLKQKFENEK